MTPPFRDHAAFAGRFSREARELSISILRIAGEKGAAAPYGRAFRAWTIASTLALSSPTAVTDAQRAETTSLLESWEHTGPDDWERLLPVVYDELRRLAHGHLAREHAARTLQTTALVHEAFIRLVDDSVVTRKGRAYFFAAASRAMRQVLVDGARRRTAGKRGGAHKEVTGLEAVDAELQADAAADELLDLNDALEELAALEPRHARVVECRFFAGMSVEETAEALSVSERTVKSDWALARAWLYRRLDGRDLS